MKPLLLGGRAESAVPGPLSTRASVTAFLTRLGAWARGSLVARGVGVLLGLGVLAAIGGSAGAGGAKPPLPSGSPAPSASAPAAEAVDAGIIPTTRPELLPHASPEEPVAAAPSPATAPATRATPDDPVDLNTARVEDLRRLPGVGAKRAEAILALRARLPGGRFRQIEDLLKVKGVGRAMLRRLHPLVRL